jgi:hypothetical protein
MKDSLIDSIETRKRRISQLPLHIIRVAMLSVILSTVFSGAFAQNTPAQWCPWVAEYLTNGHRAVQAMAEPARQRITPIGTAISSAAMVPQAPDAIRQVVHAGEEYLRSNQERLILQNASIQPFLATLNEIAALAGPDCESVLQAGAVIAGFSSAAGSSAGHADGILCAELSRIFEAYNELAQGLDAVPASRIEERLFLVSDAIGLQRLSDRAVSAEWPAAAVLALGSIREAIIAHSRMPFSERQAMRGELLATLAQQLTPIYEVWQTQCR